MADLITQAELVASAPALAGRADLALLIAAASEAIETSCGMGFAPVVDLVEVIEGTGGPVILTRYWPIAAVASVTVDGRAIADYYVDKSRGRLIRGDGRSSRCGASWPRGPANVVVTYSGGLASVPAQVKLAAILFCQILGNGFRSGNKSSETIGDYSYTLRDLAESELTGGTIGQLLAPYRRIPV